MPRVSPEQVARYAAAAGFTGWQLTMAVAISFAENGSHDTRAINRANSDGSHDVGLWQINSVHRIPDAQLFDPQKNANAAYSISHQGNDFTPWSTYNSGAAGDETNAAQDAIDKANISGEGSAGGVTGAAGDAGNAIHHAESSLNPLAWADGLAKLLGALNDRQTWIRLVEVLGGLALGLGGLYLLGRSVAAEQVGGLLRGR